MWQTYLNNYRNNIKKDQILLSSFFSCPINLSIQAEFYIIFNADLEYYKSKALSYLPFRSTRKLYQESRGHKRGWMQVKKTFQEPERRVHHLYKILEPKTMKNACTEKVNLWPQNITKIILLTNWLLFKKLASLY